MTSGIKAIDKLLKTYGLAHQEGCDPFQSLTLLHGGDKRATTMKLPWCMYEKVMQRPVSARLTYHQLYLPYRKARLASFLIDEKGEVIEQVYYQRDARMVAACRYLQRLLNKADRPIAA